MAFFIVSPLSREEFVTCPNDAKQKFSYDKQNRAKNILAFLKKPSNIIRKPELILEISSP